MSNLVSLTYYIYSTVQRYDKEREKTNKFRFYLNILSSLLACPWRQGLMKVQSNDSAIRAPPYFEPKIEKEVDLDPFLRMRLQVILIFIDIAYPTPYPSLNGGE